MFEDITYALHGLLQNFIDFVIVNTILAGTASRSMIRYHGDGGVAQAYFLRQRRFWHTSHTHHGRAIAL